MTSIYKIIAWAIMLITLIAMLYDSYEWISYLLYSAALAYLLHFNLYSVSCSINFKRFSNKISEVNYEELDDLHCIVDYVHNLIYESLCEHISNNKLTSGVMDIFVLKCTKYEVYRNGLYYRVSLPNPIKLFNMPIIGEIFIDRISIDIYSLANRVSVIVRPEINTDILYKFCDDRYNESIVDFSIRLSQKKDYIVNDDNKVVYL